MDRTLAQLISYIVNLEQELTKANAVIRQLQESSGSPEEKIDLMTTEAPNSEK